MTVPKFIAKSTAPVDRAVVTGDGLVLERFRRLALRLSAAVGRDVAALFAEPVVTRKGGLLEIAWYAEKAGDPRPLHTLDSDARRAVEADLRRKLAVLRPMLTDPEVGSLLNKSLILRSNKDIYAVGQDAILVNWGLLPDGLEQTDRPAIDRHFAATLGPFLDLSALNVTAAGPLPGDLMTQRTTQRAGRGGLGLLVATGIAAGITLVATLPGVLHQLPPGDAGPSPGDLATQRSITEAMREKVRQARDALRGAACKPPEPGRRDAAAPVDPTGHINDIANQSVVYVVVELDKSKGDVPSASDPGAPKPPSKSSFDAAGPTKAVDTAPKPSKLPGSAAPGGKPVEPDKAKGAPFSLGSGFFIGPKTVVTNRHVVENAVHIFVTNHFLGGLRPAKLVASTPNSKILEADFAVLEIETDKAPPPLALSFAMRALTNVVAIGFPGNITETDPGFYRLMKGDPTAVPEVALTAGYITNIQEADGAVPRILHSAAIAHGNSGGPLLDYCGRLLGVNTFIGQKAGYYQVNQSLSSKALAAFLDDKHISYKKDETACSVGGGALPPPIASGETRAAPDGVKPQ